jgi:8-oxo-dGTP pyrophosphatase MutT (NUDIX family)
MRRRGSARKEVSAGGIVFRRDGDRTLVLLIRDSYRNWGFPKGHVEAGEEPGTAALREVGEETGLEPLVLRAPVETIDWEFRFRGRRIHKTVTSISSRPSRSAPRRSEPRGSPPAAGLRSRRRSA